VGRQERVDSRTQALTRLSAIIHPLKDGTRGGQFMAVTLPDGTLKGNPNARRARMLVRRLLGVATRIPAYAGVAAHSS